MASLLTLMCWLSYPSPAPAALGHYAHSGIQYLLRPLLLSVPLCSGHGKWATFFCSKQLSTTQPPPPLLFAAAAWPKPLLPSWLHLLLSCASLAWLVTGAAGRQEVPLAVEGRLFMLFFLYKSGLEWTIPDRTSCVCCSLITSSENRTNTADSSQRAERRTGPRDKAELAALVGSPVTPQS